MHTTRPWHFQISRQALLDSLVSWKVKDTVPSLPRQLVAPQPWSVLQTVSVFEGFLGSMHLL